jgi:putative membrane protein
MSSGPRATDVLANERTFLAYLRTSLSFIAFGFVVARFALFTREIAIVMHTAPKAQYQSTEFGTIIALFGALIAVYGGYRYVVTDRELASDRAVGLSPIVATTGAAVVAIMGIAVGASLIAVR